MVGGRLDTGADRPHGHGGSPRRNARRLDRPLLDAAIHVAALADVADPRLYAPASIEQVCLGDPGSDPRGRVTLKRTVRDDDGITVDVTVSARGVPHLSMRSLRYRALDVVDTSPAGRVESQADARTFVHTIDWQPRTDRDGAGAGRVTGRGRSR